MNMKYTIIMANSVQELQIEVNNFLLQNGLNNLAGGPFCDGQAYCQAVYVIDYCFDGKQILKD